MTFPAAWTVIPVTGTYINRFGIPCVGWVSFSSPQIVLGNGTVLTPQTITFQLDSTGRFSGSLPATDDPLFSPANWAYTVLEKVPDGRQPFDIQVPHTSSGIDMSTVVPVAPPPTLYPYVSLQELASTASGKGAALIGWPSGFGINQPASNQFFTQNGAAVNRFPDRSFFGGATAADGAYPQVANDWLSTFYNSNGYTNYTAVGQVMIENSDSPASGEALVCAAHSLHFTNAATSSIGVTAVGVNDNATLNTQAWGIYAEGHHVSSAAQSTYACELGARSTVSTAAANPYQLGAVAALHLEAGAGISPTGQFDISACLQFASGTMKSLTGINFMAQSITGTDGVTGSGTAIAFAKGHAMQWYATGGVATGKIICQGTTSANSAQLQLADALLQIQARSNGSLQHVFNVSDANVNYLAHYGSTTGSPVAIAAGGSDANIDFKIAPKGAGVVQVGNASSMSANGTVATSLTSVGPAGSHTTVQEWLTIKNSAGVVRYIPCF